MMRDIDESRVEIKEVIELAIVDFINDLPELVNRISNDLILDLFGLRVCSFKPKLEIDPFSREGLIIQTINNITKEHADEAVELFDTSVLHESARQEFLTTTYIREAYDDYYERAVKSPKFVSRSSDRIISAINDIVFSSNAASAVIGCTNIGPTNMDVNDPHSFDGLIGQFMLEGIAEDIVVKHE